MKHAYTPLNETIQDGCDLSLFQREALWWNRAVRSLVILALLSVTTWAVLRANENGALSDLFSSAGSSSSRDAADVDVTVAPPKAPVSLTDNDLQHQWNTYEEGEWSTSTTTTPTTPARDGGLYAVATNEYSHLNNKLFPYPFLDDGILVEPFKETKITIYGMHGNTFYWSVVKKGDTSVAFHGSSEDPSSLDFSITLTEPGQYTLTVEEQYDGVQDISTMRTLHTSIWVKYVRREISTLTDTDREEFLNALHVLWDVSSKKGSAKYTDAYKSINYFALVYNDGAGNFICDEFNGGTGFLNNRAYLSLYLEQSMRLINPRVSLHYMDYSKYFGSSSFTEGHLKDTMDGGSWSDFLSEKWFGKNDPETGRILNSRWKDTTLPDVTSKLLSEEGIPLMAYLFTYDDFKKSDQHMSNPYGLLRAPWNYNPSEYLTRFNNLNGLDTTALPMSTKFKMYYGSNCAALKNFFTLFTVGKTLQNFLEAMEEQIEANIHTTFGGAGGEQAAATDAELKSKYHLTDDQLFYVAEASHKFYQTYLSGRFLAFSNNPLNCTSTPMGIRDSGTLGADAAPRCACNDYYFESESNTNQLVNLYFNHLMDGDTSILDHDWETKKGIMRLICSRMAMDGDLVGSGAAMDPLFWVAHGAAERLYQRVMFENVLTDDRFSNSKRGAPCPGHEAATTKNWLAGLSFADPAVDPAALTNVELAEVLDPRGDKYRDLLITVYDSSEYSWCGEDFDSWLEPLPSEDPAAAAAAAAAVAAAAVAAAAATGSSG